jgi:pimeloyl-ACP methyl ester carboxylesterase
MKATIPIMVILSCALGTAAGAEESVSISFDPEYGVAEAATLALEEVDVVYLEKGDGAPVIFFYPGFDYRYWQWQVEEASTRYHALAISFAPRAAGLPFDLVSTAELAAALDGLALGPVHVVAHSIAAWQAVVLAAARPELFRTLVLEEPAVGLRDAPAPECLLEDLAEAEHAACLFSSLVSGAGWFEGLPAELRSYLAEFGVGTPRTDSTGETIDPAATEFPSICEEIARLSMPILFVRGEATPAHFQAKLDEHQACLPEHETVTISGASHSVHIDRPPAYNRAVLGFIDRHER